MYRDNSLVPLEAMRTAALGVLAERPMRYAEVAAEIRRFTSRIVGPSLDLMGSSIELLRAEGLIAPEPGTSEARDPPLTLTEAGRAELQRLLRAGVRPTSGELSRLVVALKMRFLHLLPPAARVEQLDQLAALVEAERQRYRDLAAGAADRPLFGEWAAFELDLIERRLAWLADFSTRCRDR